jgi:hypothetical protein
MMKEIYLFKNHFIIDITWTPWKSGKPKKNQEKKGELGRGAEIIKDRKNLKRVE